MFKQLKKLYSLLTGEQRRKLIQLQVLVLLMSLAEIASVVSVGPFMALVADASRIESGGWITDIYLASGISDPKSFLFWAGVGVLLILFTSALISMLTIWRLSTYGARVGAELSSRLFHHYMHQPWLYHASGSSSQLTNRIAQESQRVTDGIISPLMQMNAKLVLAILLALAIFLYNPMVAIAGLTIFAAAYVILFRVVRRRLVANGNIITQAQRQRFQLMSEGFGGIKDALLLGRQSIFVNRFDQAGKSFSRANGANQAMGQVPRYAMELVAFGSVIFLVLYLLSTHEGDLGKILPILSVYALAGFKLLPALQQIYTSLSYIRGNIAAFESLKDDLQASVQSNTPSLSKSLADNKSHWVPKHSIRLQDVTFAYPGKDEPALKGLSLDIPVNQVIGLVGSSGSGKSTAIDLLLGLIEPQSGQLLIDGQPLTSDKCRAWQNALGFVPQSIFLADSSIRENVAFGLPRDQVDDERVQRALEMAHLDDLVAALPEGVHTRVGERGVQLSGGQRQRIGIARALYHDADILILDEATSALDGITEKLIMDAIHDFSGQKTIIMIAHRLATVKKCDRIYLLEQGRVVDEGHYDELTERNEVFKRMVEHA